MLKDNLMTYTKRKGIRDQHVAETLVHDVLMKPKAKGVEYAELRFRILDHQRKQTLEESRQTSLDAIVADELDATLADVLPYDDTQERESRLQVEQRQLIESLTNDSDERTTLIVQTFLDTEKPTVNNVAAKLGLHHTVVKRALTRLASKYDVNRYGDLNDYFVA